MLLTLALTLPALAQEVIVDDEDGSPGFTTTGDDWTTWSTNGHGYDGGDTEYHYLSHTVGGDDRRGTATWSPDLPQEGTYEIAVHFRLTENRTRDADHVVTDGTGATTKVVVDQYGDGASGWISLGDYWCGSGRGGCSVTLDGTDDDDSDAANATRFTLVEAGGDTQEPDPDPGEEIADCAEFPGLGAHTQVAYATELDAVDWTDEKQAKGAPDGVEATTPNVDAGEYLMAWGWDLCDPVGEETLDSVTLEVKARTQYDSGKYEVQLLLDGEGTAGTVFNGTALDWHSVDLTADRGSWTWTSTDATRGRITLHDHPEGNRDSDAWVDAWRLTVAFTTTADEGSDTEDPPPDTAGTDDADTGPGPEDSAPGDTADGDTGDSGSASRPADPYYEQDQQEVACGCNPAASGHGRQILVGLGLLLLGRRRRR